MSEHPTLNILDAINDVSNPYLRQDKRSVITTGQIHSEQREYNHPVINHRLIADKLADIRGQSRIIETRSIMIKRDGSIVSGEEILTNEYDESAIYLTSSRLVRDNNDAYPQMFLTVDPGVGVEADKLEDFLIKFAETQEFLEEYTKGLNPKVVLSIHLPSEYSQDKILFDIIEEKSMEKSITEQRLEMNSTILMKRYLAGEKPSSQDIGEKTAIIKSQTIKKYKGGLDLGELTNGMLRNSINEGYSPSIRRIIDCKAMKGILFVRPGDWINQMEREAFQSIDLEIISATRRHSNNDPTYNPRGTSLSRIAIATPNGELKHVDQFMNMMV